MRDFERFTNRHVNKREKLFNPEVSDWPVEADRGANWDWLIFILASFGVVIGLGVMGIVLFLSSLFMVWP